ncbi:MAG TPA: glycosyltransferase family 39 protein [Longimicrobiales bacterium]|nr:glycosyltransferase family 39 protein [Longimicrobiales bacterium]
MRTALLLAGVAFVLYASGLRWGLPYATAPERVDAWAVDDETPLGPLAELHNILDPKPDRNLGYPLLYPFTVLVAYAPYMVYLAVTDGLESPGGEYPFGLSDPVLSLRVLGLIAHLVTTLLAVAAVVATYDAARVAWGRRAGVAAALFAMTAAPMFYYARTGNVDVPMLCFLMLAYAAFARMVVSGYTVRRAVALGIFVGLSLATKEAALGAFLAMPVVVFELSRRQRQLPVGSMAFWKPHLQALLASFLALGAGSGLFVEPGRYLAHLRYLGGRVNELAVSDAGSAAVRTFGYTFGEHIAYARALLIDLQSILNPGGLALAAAGVAIACWRRERAALLIVPIASYLGWIFLSLRAAQVRYMLPAAVMLACFAGYAVLCASRSKRPVFRYGVSAAAVVILLVQLLRGVDLTYQMVNDSRFAAAAWFEQQARPGDRVEFFGPSQKLPPLDAQVVSDRATGYYGMYVPAQVDEAKVQEILSGWQERRPRFVIAIPDHTSPAGVQHSHTFPSALFNALMEARYGFHPAVYFRTPPLFPWLPAARLDYPVVNPPIQVFEALGENENRPPEPVRNQPGAGLR